MYVRTGKKKKGGHNAVGHSDMENLLKNKENRK